MSFLRAQLEYNIHAYNLRQTTYLYVLDRCNMAKGPSSEKRSVFTRFAPWFTLTVYANNVFYRQPINKSRERLTPPVFEERIALRRECPQSNCCEGGVRNEVVTLFSSEACDFGVLASKRFTGLIILECPLNQYIACPIPMRQGVIQHAPQHTPSAVVHLALVQHYKSAFESGHSENVA